MYTGRLDLNYKPKIFPIKLLAPVKLLMTTKLIIVDFANNFNNSVLNVSSFIGAYCSN